MAWGNSGWGGDDGWYLNKAAGGGTFTPTSTQSSNFLTRVGVVTGGNNTNHFGLSTNECTAVDALITGIITDLGGNTSLSTWPIIDALYILATTSAAVAKLNLVSSSYTLVPNGTPVFTADQGYSGVGFATAYLETTFDPTAVAGQNWSQNSATFAAYLFAVASTDVKSAGGNSSGTLVSRIYPNFGGAAYMAANQSAFDPQTATGHFYGISRTGATAVATYVDAATSGVLTRASVAPVGTTLVFLNDGSALSNSLQATMSAGLIGGGMTATQIGNVRSRLATYMASVP